MSDPRIVELVAALDEFTGVATWPAGAHLRTQRALAAVRNVEWVEAVTDEERETLIGFVEHYLSVSQPIKQRLAAALRAKPVAPAKLATESRSDAALIAEWKGAIASECVQDAGDALAAALEERARECDELRAMLAERDRRLADARNLVDQIAVALNRIGEERS